MCTLFYDSLAISEQKIERPKKKKRKKVIYIFISNCVFIYFFDLKPLFENRITIVYTAKIILLFLL